MYIDDDFREAIEPIKRSFINDCKRGDETPYILANFDDGEIIILNPSDFESDGNLSDDKYSFITNPEEPNEIIYMANLECSLKTSPSALFLESVKPFTAYVVTSGEYSDYHIEGVFSTEAKAKNYADKTDDRDVNNYDMDDPQMLQEKDWYRVDIYVDESFGAKDAFTHNLSDMSPAPNERYFDAVKFTKKQNGTRYFSFFLSAESLGKAKAIGLERFHSLLPVIDWQYPMLKWVRIVNYNSLYYAFESLIFEWSGSRKAHFYSCERERIQDLFVKVKDFLPIPITEEEEDNIDWQNLTAETCQQIMKEHGLDVICNQGLPWDYYG